MNLKKGFTLAEVLITLGIIGVISAITVPTLIQNYQKQSYVTKLHKFYTELSQAILQFQTDKNAINIKEAGLTTSIDSAIIFFKTYFRIVNDCGNEITPCMGENYKNMYGNSISLTQIGGNTKRNCFTLASGTGLCIYRGIGNVLSQIAVDINSSQGPNIAGRDLFIMYIYSNGRIDDLKTTCTDDNTCSWDGNNNPLTKEEREEMFEKACNSKTSYYHGCFGKILNDNWEMKY